MRTAKANAIEYADIEWHDHPMGEVAFSRQFNDVYFSRRDGLAESQHVFLHGNHLPERLSQLADYQYFCVGETGFGSGLNFFALWQLWQQVRPNNHSWLHMVSIEKFPLKPNDLARILQRWPQLTEAVHLFLQQYPPPLAGVHRLIFTEQRLSLDLWLGDASDCLPRMYNEKPFDAWFLDGFAPAKNPDLWQEPILKHLLRLSAIGTTFASFSVAGAVKYGLQALGMTVTRPKGFGRKRQMLSAYWPAVATQTEVTHDPVQPSPANETTTEPAFHRLPKQQHIAIIGAGIAGLSAAYALARRGHRVTLLEKTAALAGASGNPLALLLPKLGSLANVHDHLITAGWLSTLRWWSVWSDQVLQQTGGLQCATASQKIDLTKFADYPTDIAQPHAQGLSIARAGLLKPTALRDVVLAHPLIDLVQADIVAIQAHTQTIELLDRQQQRRCFDAVVVCNALHCQQLAPQLPKLSPIRGQVSWVDCAPEQLPNVPLSYGGYCAAQSNGQINGQSNAQGQSQLLFGASFVRQDDQDDLRDADHAHNAALLASVLPDTAANLPPQHTWQGRASIRAQTQDYFPLVGRVQADQNIFVLSGLGSKGFSFAPLCAELLAAQMLGECWPVSQALGQKLCPQRQK